MTLQKDSKNITSGNLFVGILRFAFPLFLATLVQTLFTAVDTAVVGNFANAVAVASIGACGNIINLLVNCFIAFANGAGIIIAKAIGANNAVKVKKSVDTALIFSLILGAIVMVFAELTAVPLLSNMDCPAECFDGAVLYLRIYMLGTPAVMVYNFAAAIIRSEGDSKRPLYYVILSGLVNVVTNIFLCLVLPNKVAAVAIATILSQVVSAVLAMHRLITKKDSLCRFSVKKLTFDWTVLKEVFKYGIPLALTASLYPLSHLQVQSAINSFGSACLAGNTACNNINSLVTALQVSFNTSCVTFVSQNIGAKNKKRVTQSILICGGCAVASGLVLGLSTCFLFSRPLLSIFLPGNEEAIAYGQLLMRFSSAFIWINAIFGCTNAATQAFGYPSFSTINNLFSVLGFRVVWMNLVYAKYPTVEVLFMCYPVAWTLSSVISICFFFYAYTKHWKKPDSLPAPEQISAENL